MFSGQSKFKFISSILGIETITLDNNKKFNADIKKDILDVSAHDFAAHPFIIYAAPPCTAFSKAGYQYHWKGKGNTRSLNENSKKYLLYYQKTISLINELNPQYFYIENPEGLIHLLIETKNLQFFSNIFIDKTSYCQYGFSYQKPTIIIHNNSYYHPKKCCKRKSICHEYSPRTKNNGCTRIRSSTLRSLTPNNLIFEIILNSIYPGLTKNN